MGDFFGRLLWGVIQGPPPSKKHGFGKLHQSTPRIRRISEKSAEIPPPGGWPSEGQTRTFPQNRQNGGGGVDLWDLTEKLVKIGGYPHFALFGDFGDFW